MAVTIVVTTTIILIAKVGVVLKVLNKDPGVVPGLFVLCAKVLPAIGVSIGNADRIY